MLSINDRLMNFDLFDSHLHIIDRRFPLVANNGFLPEEYTCEHYLARTAGYRLVGGAVVSGSFQAFDQGYLLDALQRLGSSFVGVTQLPASVTDEELCALHKGGVRAVRFNLKRGGSEEVGQLDALARRVHEVVGWHVELYADAAELEYLVPTIIALPAVGIDHLGLSRAGLGTLLRLVDAGARVKATGFGRVDFEVTDVLRQIHAANPDALMFGTDLPSTRAPRPYTDDDFHLVADALGDDGARRVFCGNAVAWYRVGK